MTVLFRFKDFGVVQWHQRGIERLRQVLRHPQRFLASDRPPEVLALIPVRAAQPHVTRQQHRSIWRK